MNLIDRTVTDFIGETASSSPAPGGGSIAALNAAAGAALIAMVASLTIGKEKYAEAQAEMETVLAEATIAKDRFLAFIDEDSNAFNRTMAAFRLPKETDEEKATRTEAIQTAYKGASMVPFEVGVEANKLLSLAEKVIRHGNVNAVTDGAVAAMNARTAVRSAFYNVKINLGGIKDQAFVTDMETRMKAIEDDLDEREWALLNLVKL